MTRRAPSSAKRRADSCEHRKIRAASLRATNSLSSASITRPRYGARSRISRYAEQFRRDAELFRVSRSVSCGRQTKPLARSPDLVVRNEAPQRRGQQLCPLAVAADPIRARWVRAHALEKFLVAEAGGPAWPIAAARRPAGRLCCGVRKTKWGEQALHALGRRLQQHVTGADALRARRRRGRARHLAQQLARDNRRSLREPSRSSFRSAALAAIRRLPHLPLLVRKRAGPRGRPRRRR